MTTKLVSSSTNYLVIYREQTDKPFLIIDIDNIRCI